MNRRTTNRLLRTLVVVLMITGIASVSTLACEFSFSYDRIEAPIGTEGEIGVRVEKTHKQCTMEDSLDYQFDWKHIQIMGETEWKEASTDVYEKWFWVSLSSSGEGFLKIFKTCSKEGYEEAVLPITVTQGEESGVWKSSFQGEYPYPSTEDIETKNVFGEPNLNKSVLRIEGLEVRLPIVPAELADYKDFVRVYYTLSDKEYIPLLVTSKDFYLRFDQYQNL